MEKTFVKTLEHRWGFFVESQMAVLYLNKVNAS